MIIEDKIKKVICDLEKRKLEVEVFICQTQSGNLRVIGYDNDGMVNFISKEVKDIVVFEKLENKTLEPIGMITQTYIKKG